MKRKINVFLLGIPVVLYLNYAYPDDERIAPVVFVLAALSLLPLAAFVESAVEDLAELLGQFIGGLLHTTFGNLAELAIGITILLATARGELPNGAEIVRASIAGAAIRNSLLFLGLATIAGSWRNGKMKFDVENASEYSTVFALAVIGLALPTAMAMIFPSGSFGEQAQLNASLAIAAILLVSYLAYILFAVFRVAEGTDLRVQRHRKRQARAARRARTQPSDSGSLPLPAPPDVNALFEEERERAEARLASEAAGPPEQAAPAVAFAGEAAQGSAAPSRKRIDPKGMRLEARRQEREERGEEGSGFLGRHPVLRGLIAAVVLAVSAAGVVVMSERFVGSIEHVATTFLGGNEFFVGLILIPVVGGMVELTGAVGMARRNRMEITMAVTAGASIQMILLVAPVLVFVAWRIGTPFDLVFQPLALAVFVASSFVFMLLGRDGESTLLEGVQLCAFWVLTAGTAFFMKG